MLLFRFLFPLLLLLASIDNNGGNAEVVDAEFSKTGSIHNNEDDRVLSVPGYSGNLCWSHYAGYLNGKDEDHQLFYWYHEAVSNPEEKPLVLWLNGGPGCSSLGGMFTELGPFVVDNDSNNVTLNPFSFNKVANMLFIEQPVGVGFSYSATHGSSTSANDESTAIDTVMALRQFLKEKHPELQGRPFYVMGESYGGHYVPNTVKEIQKTNLLFAKTEHINIKGFAVGNGYTDWQLDFNANVENGRYHALTSESKWQAAQKACNGDYARCFWPRSDIDCPEECANAVHDATVDAMDGSIDIYDIYNDVCLKKKDHQERLHTQLSTLLQYRRDALSLQQQQQRGNVGNSGTTTTSSSSSLRALRATISPVFPTCIDAMSANYLNLPQVQTAIHVRPGTVPTWFDCSPTLRYEFNYESELSNYKEWVASGDLEILIYNGDADYILSHMGNSAWINQGLKLPILKEWTKWHGSDGQVAGYFERYSTAGSSIPFTFLTVKGAGHMVPRDRPRHALDFFTKFLAGGGKYDMVERTTVDEPLC